MSWSVSYVGTPAETKEFLAPQFASAKEATKANLYECTQVELAETMVNNQLDFMIQNSPDTKVYATASGSAAIAPEGASWKTYTQLSITFNEVYQVTASVAP